MQETHFLKIAGELSLRPTQVQSVAKLIAEGGTVPFIARYRKEATDSLDEVAITNIRDRLVQLAELDKRRESIVKSLEERKLLTEELQKKIDGAETMTVLEDIYQPFRPKRRTRATIAREKGLEPLADYLLEHQSADPAGEAKKYVDAEKEVATVADALAGARDIIAERISDDAEARAEVRKVYMEEAEIISEVMIGKEEEGNKFKDYFDWKEPLKTAPSHRVLAIRRGEREGFLLMRITPPEDKIVNILSRRYVTSSGPAGQEVRQAAEDCFKRLLGPSMETEMRLFSKKRADEDAVKVFADNLRELLLASPLGQKRVLAIDPGFRTGCKVVCLDAQGKLLHNDVIYIEQSAQRTREAMETIQGLVVRHQIEAIAIGNGTASRETEAFVRGLGLPKSILVTVVSESGASVYSASEVAREEFADYDLTVRGAVSIGRRLMDPLAELVKIDPKSIGVGQYQHDVDQLILKNSLDDTVISCVNGVGVELNTASKQLLSYVSGLNGSIAANIVDYRNENGAFKSRAELKKVARLGPKAFEQAAGFLRIRNAPHPLDRSGVHPESYAIVEQMAKDLGCSIEDLIRDNSLRQKIKLENYVTDTVGLPTLKDIRDELAKPGRDPREKFEEFQFAEGVEKPQDLKPGMRLPGIVTNVAAFGAFVDVGVHQDGLVHVSQLADKFVKDPAEVVKVGQKVQVTVVEVDLQRNRISLSMRTQVEIDRRGGSQGGDSRQNGPSRHGQNRPRGGENRGGQRRGGGDSFGTSLGGDWFSDALNKK